MKIEDVKSIIDRELALSFTEKAKAAILPFLRKRKMIAYCIGTAKSGTHSVADIFGEHYRSYHEPENHKLIYLKFLYDHNKVTDKKITLYLKRRDTRLNLDMESSDFAGLFFHQFLAINSDSKFILPIRDCYSFLDSIINHQLNNPVEHNSIWRLGRDVNYGYEQNFPPEEAALEAKTGLYPIEGYLKYWSERNLKVLNTVPTERLFAVQTNKLSQRAGEIAKFLEVSLDSLHLQKAHSFKAPQKYNMLKNIDADYIEDLVTKTGCREVMAEFYPTIKNMSDALS